MSDLPDGMKRCSKCGRVGPLAGFDKAMCKPCVAARKKAYREANSSAVATHMAAYRVANRERINARAAAYRLRNIDKINARLEACREAKKEASRVAKRDMLKRKALERDAQFIESNKTASRPFFYDEESTLLNMCPDHLRIIDHKFLMTPALPGEFDDLVERNGPSANSKKVIATAEDGTVLEFDSTKKAGEYFCLSCTSIQNRVKDGKRMKNGYCVVYA